MFDLKALDSLIQKVGKSQMEAEERQGLLTLTTLGLEQEDYKNNRVQSKKKEKEQQKQRLKNRPFGESLLVNSTEDGDKGEVQRMGTAINWLCKLCETLVDKVNELSIQGKEVVAKEEKLEKEVEAKVEKVELAHDELQQRSMKGNIIVSSPSNGSKQTLFVREKVREGGVTRNESDVAMVSRAIRRKSLVGFEPGEVEECHPLGPKPGDGQEPTTWVIRIGNRKPGSHYATLCAGMKTGYNSTAQSNFSKDNLYLNHQITPRKAKFLKDVVKVAFSEKKIGKYLVDERGQIRIKKVRGSKEQRGDQYNYWTVTSKEEVERVISSDFNFFKSNKKN